jgi:glycosyltransferase involved in cell wall biosynthesis
LLKRDEVLQLQKSCTVLINPRPKNGEYTKYSFPSKIMEYMSSGTPVIAYKLEGIPEEYYEHIYMVNDDKGGLFGTLKDVLCKDEQELFRKGQIAKEFVLTQKSGEKQGEKILQMLNHL